jgi:hypothetical protein
VSGLLLRWTRYLRTTVPHSKLANQQPGWQIKLGSSERVWRIALEDTWFDFLLPDVAARNLSLRWLCLSMCLVADAGWTGHRSILSLAEPTTSYAPQIFERCVQYFPCRSFRRHNRLCKWNLSFSDSLSIQAGQQRPDPPDPPTLTTGILRRSSDRIWLP